MTYPIRKYRESWDRHLRWAGDWCRAVRTALVVGVFAWLAGAGCVTTAECDEYVECSDDAVCYQSRCLPRCGGESDCDDGESCVSCYPQEDDGSGPGRCYGTEANVCLADDEG